MYGKNIERERGKAEKLVQVKGILIEAGKLLQMRLATHSSYTVPF